MKKIVLLITVSLLLLLWGCNKNPGEQQSGTTTTTTDSHQKIQQAAEKVKNGNLGSFSEYSDEELEEIVSAVAKDGYSLEIKDDGSGILSNEEGEWIVGKGWVENEYTKGVPEIDFGEITMSVEDEDSQGKYYMFLIRSASFLEAENYVETLCQRGFDNIQDKVINQKGNMIVFNAQNDQGKKVSLGYSSNGFTLKLSE